MGDGCACIDHDIPVAELAVEVDDDLLLGVREEAALEVRAEVVGPAQAAALAAAQQARELGHRAPAAMAVGQDEVDELAVLLRRPRPPLHPKLVAARLPPHPKLPKAVSIYSAELGFARVTTADSSTSGKRPMSERAAAREFTARPC
jgi:hypothetical protein